MFNGIIIIKKVKNKNYKKEIYFYFFENTTNKKNVETTLHVMELFNFGFV